MLKAPSIEGAFSFQRHHYREATGGGVLVTAEVLTESLGKSYPWAAGFFFGNTELSMELWTTIARISGFDA